MIYRIRGENTIYYTTDAVSRLEDNISINQVRSKKKLST
jgi:hypothetical protein